MIYEQFTRDHHHPTAALTSSMAYNPFMFHRPADYSMSSILAQPQYLHGMAMSHHHGIPSSILPKLQQVSRSPLTPADVLIPQTIRPLRSLEPPEAEVHDDPKVELESKDLWTQFHSFGTEMVITKSGR